MPVSRDGGGADGGPLRNVLGETSEFFTGVPAFSRCFGNGFFVLECETLTRRTPQQVDTRLYFFVRTIFVQKRQCSPILQLTLTL